MDIFIVSEAGSFEYEVVKAFKSELDAIAFIEEWTNWSSMHSPIFIIWNTLSKNYKFSRWRIFRCTVSFKIK